MTTISKFAAEETARRLGLEVQILYAENDSITQSQQLLKIIQSTPRSDVYAIVVEPAGGTALPQVAQAGDRRRYWMGATDNRNQEAIAWCPLVSVHVALFSSFMWMLLSFALWRPAVRSVPTGLVEGPWIYSTVPPRGSIVANCRPWIRPISW